MKLGVSYNVFDGEELLESSINQIRSEVDYISVVYQSISNYGNECSDKLIPTLKELKKSGLVDELFHYQPNLNKVDEIEATTNNDKLYFSFIAPPPVNEIIKRNIGLDLSKKHNCTHHMSIDSDEFYIKDQFRYLKQDMIENDYDSSICEIETYYKQSDYKIEPKDRTHVSLIYKIRNNVNFISNFTFPALVDPTRRMDPGKYKIYSPDEIQMHHMSYLRKDIRRKVMNSSSRVLFYDAINLFCDYYNKWEPGMNALMPGSSDAAHKLVKTEDYFKIKF